MLRNKLGEKWGRGRRKLMGRRSLLQEGSEGRNVRKGRRRGTGNRGDWKGSVHKQGRKGEIRDREVHNTIDAVQLTPGCDTHYGGSFGYFRTSKSCLLHYKVWLNYECNFDTL